MTIIAHDQTMAIIPPGKASLALLYYLPFEGSFVSCIRSVLKRLTFKMPYAILRE